MKTVEFRNRIETHGSPAATSPFLSNVTHFQADISTVASSSPFGIFLQSGVATAYYLPPNHPVFNVRLLRTNFPHILLHHIQNLLFGFPLLLFPGNSISIILLPTYSWSLLMTCPYHLSLPSLIFIPNRSTLTVPLICSFLILSFLVTPIANLNIFKQI